MIEGVLVAVSTDPVIHSGSDPRYSGVKALWVKVIARAIYDFVSYKDHADLTKRKWAEDASVWLFQPSVLFNGLENICYHLGIAPEMVRRRAQKMTKDEVAKMEHLEREGTLSLKELAEDEVD